VRTLDTRIAGNLATQESEKAAFEQLQDEQKALCETEAATKADLKKLQTRQADAEAYQAAHAHDAALVEQLAAILQSLEHLENLSAEKTQAETAANQTAAFARKAAAATAGEEGKLAAAQQVFAQAETALESVAGELKTRLDGRPLTDWCARLDALRRRITIEQRILETREATRARSAEAAAAQQELILKRNEQEGLQREQALVTENLQLQQKIESLEAEREALADGQPCPLCGSLEHPYAAGLPSRETSSLNKINAALSSLSNQINALTEKQAGANADCKTLLASLRKDEAEIETLAPGSSKEAEQLAARIGEIEKLEQQDKEARTALDEAREVLSRQTLAEQNAKQNAGAATEQSKMAEARQLSAEAARSKAESRLRQQIEPFGIPLAPEAAMQLTGRRDQWITSDKQASELKQTISNLHTTLAGLAKQIGQQETRIRKQADTVTATGTAIDHLKTERTALFGDRNPDAVEQETQASREASRIEHETAQTRAADRKQALSLALQNFQTLEKRKQEILEQLDEADRSFIETLAAAGFETEAAWLSARLDEAEQSRIDARAEELKQRHTRLAALEAEKTQQLQAERNQTHVESSPEAHAALAESCIELQQQIGGLKDRIQANEKAKERHSEKLGEIEKQQIECTRWNMLHELIGSADGKKFRNFAQGLTFELMVSHANRQLAKMSDRYLLVRDKLQPLDLNVVDNYQAGETRPVRNLSGGESFIVSLSLALGLSQMASKQIRVDSLFLDEGFGTLDEDALETALEALAELKQDGKLIGVISHVAAMKERISTQINVEPTRGGRSRLSGTGVIAGK
jgi:exonuclease SbcC